MSSIGDFIIYTFLFLLMSVLVTLRWCQDCGMTKDIIQACANIAIVLTFIVVVFQLQEHKKANDQNRFHIIHSMRLRELDVWANEMFVATVFEDTSDYQNVMNQSGAGVPYAFIRHILTRHGRAYAEDTASRFPEVVMRNADPNWKKRFADGVCEYIAIYKRFVSEAEMAELNEELKGSIAGRLYKELTDPEVYTDSPQKDSIIQRLKSKDNSQHG